MISRTRVLARRAPTSAVVLLAFLLLAVLGLVAGCDSGTVGPGPHGKDALDRAQDVGSDRYATAKQVVAAGGPQDINVSGDRTMITWQARDFEYGEGDQQSAWSLYDDRGHRITQGKLKWYAESHTVHAVPGGFVIKQTTRTPYWEYVGRKGQVTRLTVSAGPEPSRAGDVFLGFTDPYGPASTRRRPVVYRAGENGAPGRVVRLDRVPGNGTEPQLAVAADGSAWLMDHTDGAVVRRSADGRAPWHTERVPVPARARGSQLVAIGDQVYLVAVDPHGPDGTFDSLWKRTTGANGSWEQVPTDGVDGLTETGVLVPTDGKLVLADIHWKSPQAYVRLADGRFRNIPLTKGTGMAHQEIVRVIGDDIYLYPGQMTNLKVSHDDGKTWKYVAR